MHQREVSLSQPLSANYYRPQRSWGKVIFSQASVILLIRGVWWLAPGGCLLLGGGGCLVPGGVVTGPRGVPPPGGAPRGGGVPGGDPRDGYCCGRYASYWNAFLSLRYVHTTGDCERDVRKCHVSNVTLKASINKFRFHFRNRLLWMALKFHLHCTKANAEAISLLCFLSLIKGSFILERKRFLSFDVCHHYCRCSINTQIGNNATV